MLLANLRDCFLCSLCLLEYSEYLLVVVLTLFQGWFSQGGQARLWSGYQLSHWTSFWGAAQKIPALHLTTLTKKLLKARGDGPFQNTMAVLGAKYKMDKNAMASMPTTPVMEDRFT